MVVPDARGEKHVVVDGSTYDWTDIVSGAYPYGWTVQNYRNDCATERSTPINGSPAWTTDVVANP